MINQIEGKYRRRLQLIVSRNEMAYRASRRETWFVIKYTRRVFLPLLCVKRFLSNTIEILCVGRAARFVLSPKK